MNEVRAVVIGDREDVHVQAVLGSGPDSDVLVLNAELLAQSRVSLSDGSLVIECDGESWNLPKARRVRGWIRRIASETWQRGVISGSQESAEAGAWLALLAAICRLPQIRWLTQVDASLIAENKVHQLVAAKSLGITVPDWVVSNDHKAVQRGLPEPRVVKTVGPGRYMQGAAARVVYTQSIDDSRLELIGDGVPLLFQKQLNAKHHLRVVTVRDDVWACSLDALEWSLDWRTDDGAHSSFRKVEPPIDVATGALAIARELGLGYTSQDWILTEDGPYLVDVNPAGQWLFLDSLVADEVTESVRGWLHGEVLH